MGTTVSNHPNRSTWRSKIPIPTPEQILEARVQADLTQDQAATIAGLSSGTRLAEYESGARRPHWSLWEMFLLLTKQHPRWKLVRRRDDT